MLALNKEVYGKEKEEWIGVMERIYGTLTNCYEGWSLIGFFKIQFRSNSNPNNWIGFKIHIHFNYIKFIWVFSNPFKVD